MQLPCRHIFKARELQQQDLFSEELISDRWKLESYRNHRIFTSSMYGKNESTCATPADIGRIVKSSKPISQSAKFRKTQILTQKIATLVSEKSNEE